MAHVEQMKSVSVPAAGDLGAKQFRFVVVDVAGEIDVPAAGGDADGVLIDKPRAQGRVGTMVYAGRVKVVAGATGVTAGDKVQTDAAGAAITATNLDHVLGKALTTGTVGVLVEVLLISKHILGA